LTAIVFVDQQQELKETSDVIAREERRLEKRKADLDATLAGGMI